MSIERPKIENVSVKRVLPEGGTEALKGLYLNPPLLPDIAGNLRRMIVAADYVTDKNGIIAVKKSGRFIPPPEITNLYDWRLFQELTSQSDAIISSGKYLNGFAKGQVTQNIFTQFEPNGGFGELGEWRLKNGYSSRNPDIVIPSRSLAFSLPKEILNQKRQVIIFTTRKMAYSQEAKDLKSAGKNVRVEIAGDIKDEGVDGKKMIEHLDNLDYRFIFMATGPSVFKILLDSEVLDRIYITEVQREVVSDSPSEVTGVLEEGKKVEDLKGFNLTGKYLQEGVITNDGKSTTQHFLIYDSDKFKAEREKHGIGG